MLKGIKVGEYIVLSGVVIVMIIYKRKNTLVCFLVLSKHSQIRYR
jgi:hypothetical protein